MSKDEALRLALEALKHTESRFHTIAWGREQDAITAIKAALANEALERKAENARELGLDYEPYGFEASIYSNARMKVDVVTGNVSIGTVKKPCGLECDCTDVCKLEAKDDPVAQGSIQHLKIMMEESAWEGRIELSDVLANIDEFYTTPPQQNDYKALWQQMCERCDDLDKELAATDRQVEILSDSLSQLSKQQAKDEPVAWRDAAIRLGEELSSVGPDGYYDMDAKEWLDWAMEQSPRGEHSLPQRTWVGLTDEEKDHLFNMYERSSFGLVRAVEAKLKEKNT